MAAAAAPAIIAAVGSILGGAMGGKGGGGSDVSYAQSPEQREIYQLALPYLQKMFSGEGGYQIPDIQQMMPTTGWYQNLAPEVRAGIASPYTDASRQLTESLGGSAGSARAGSTGQLISTQSDFWAQAGEQMGTQGWGMISPALSAGWQAQLQQNMFPYTSALGAIGSTYSQPVVSPDSGFSSQGALGGALAGGYGGYQLGQAWPQSQSVTPYQTGWAQNNFPNQNFYGVNQYPY